jgi:hypothetical protein
MRNKCCTHSDFVMLIIAFLSRGVFLVLVLALFFSIHSIRSIFFGAESVRAGRSFLSSGRNGSSQVVRIDYVPSDLEKLWSASLAQWNDEICSTMGSTDQAGKVSELLELFDSQERFLDSSEHATLLSRAIADGLMSRLDRTFADGSVERTFLAPLVGMLRDPRVSCPEGKRGFWGAFADPGDEWAMQKRMWLLISGRNSPSYYKERQLRALLFDIGASKWASASANGVRWLTPRSNMRKLASCLSMCMRGRLENCRQANSLRELQLQM